MKNTWSYQKLGDILKTGTGGTPLTSRKEYYQNGNIPWLLSGEVRQGEIWSTSNLITQAGLNNSSAKIFPPETVLVAMYGATAGQVGLLKIPSATNQAICGIYPHPSIISKFLYYVILFNQEKLIAQSTGNAQPNISQQKIRNIEIPIITIAEQQRIVRTLDKAFEGIAIAKANAEKNLYNVRTFFKSQCNSIFTQIGSEGWRMKLNEVCDFLNGRAYNKNELLKEGKYRVLRVGNFFTNNNWYYSNLELEPAKYCEKGDLLYAWSASFGPRIWNGDKVIYHYHIWKVIPKSTIVKKKYLFYLLEWDIDQLKQKYGTGTTMMHVSKGSMESRVVPIPSLEAQKQIIIFLDNFHKYVHQLEAIYQKKIEALDNLKNSLLNQAFTGNL